MSIGLSYGAEDGVERGPLRDGPVRVPPQTMRTVAMTQGADDIAAGDLGSNHFEGRAPLHRVADVEALANPGSMVEVHRPRWMALAAIHAGDVLDFPNVCLENPPDFPGTLRPLKRFYEPRTTRRLRHALRVA